MNYKDYKRIKVGQFQSVGMFGEEIYAYENLTGACCVPEYIQITKEEFDTFEIWSREVIADLDKLYEIHNRPVLCSGYKGKTEFAEVGKEVECPVCHTSFLLSGGDIPEHLDTSKCCPECNSLPEPRRALIVEIKKQLKKAGVVVTNLGLVLKTYYIEPYTKYDMRGYVEVGQKTYYLRVNERGKLILEYQVMDVKEAAYWVLKQLLYDIEYEKYEADRKSNKRIEEKIKIDILEAFKCMDNIYAEWYLVGKDIFRFK